MASSKSKGNSKKKGKTYKGTELTKVKRTREYEVTEQSRAIKLHLGRLLPNLACLFLTAFGSIILAWVGWLTWYDVTTFGKDVALVFFGSRTGEAVSLGIGMRVIYYFLIGSSLLLSGLLAFLLRRSNINLRISRLLRAQLQQEKEEPPVFFPDARALEENLQLLQSENEALKQELLRYRRLPSGKIGFTLLIIGALALVASFVATSTILAFIGLSLTFWGALFLFAKPIKFVRSTLLDSTALSSYTTIDRIIEDMNYKGKPIYIPPYPKEAYLPEYLKGLKEMVVFISAEDITTMPTIEEMAKKQFLVENPKGICVTPPGSGLVSLFEKELRADFTKIDLEGLYNSLPTAIMNNLELASNFEIDTEKKLVHVKITDSVYKDLYSKEHKLKSVHSVGCPLTSAVACALAKTTGKLVTIAKSNVSPDLKTIEVWYQTLEG